MTGHPMGGTCRVKGSFRDELKSLWMITWIVVQSITLLVILNRRWKVSATGRTHKTQVSRGTERSSHV